MGGIRSIAAEDINVAGGVGTGADRSGFAPLLWALKMREGLTSTTKAVLVTLASYADKTGSCFPTVDRIADDARLSKRTCQSALSDLEAAGFIAVNRNVGRGHSSVYNLNIGISNDAIKGANAAPFNDGEKAQQLHHLKPQKVQLTHLKGAAVAPQLPIELTAVAKRPKARGKRHPKSPLNPRRCDPPECWHHLADRQPDGSPRLEAEQIAGRDHVHALVAGNYLDVAAGLVCDAAKITDPKWRGTWPILAAWLRDGISLHDTILPVISRVAARSSYSPASSLRYFDQAVREKSQGR